MSQLPATGMHPHELAAFDALLAAAPLGPRIELGVFRGATLARIAQHEGLTIGVDSFAGMAEPTDRDLLDGRNHYPRGRLAVSSASAAAAAPCAKLVQGWVPEVLGTLPSGLQFGFAHVDMDHYAPTLAALDWLWSRMLPGGIIVCDDWFEGRDVLAAGAIAEFARTVAGELSSCGRKAWWTKW